MSNKVTTTASDGTTTGARENALKRVVKHDVPAELMRQCLDTGLFDITRHYTFYGSLLQCMNINYSYMVPTAGVGFNADMKRYELYINPLYFCKALKPEQREAVLVHEMSHITNKHLIRVPFMKVSEHKRRLFNIGGDMAINQTIRNLPRGCQQCPPIEAQQKGEHCKNDLCPGYAIDVKDWHDTDVKTGKKTQWATGKTMEFYFEKLMERYEEPEENKKNDNKQIAVDTVVVDPIDVTPSGVKRGKTLTANANGAFTNEGKTFKVNSKILVANQKDRKDNGVYTLTATGDSGMPFVLTRAAEHDGGDAKSMVRMQDCAVQKVQKVYPPVGWVVITKPKDLKNPVLDVDVQPLEWQEVELNIQDSEGDGPGPGDGSGTPREFDSHNWTSGAEEGDVLDATEELVKRAMTKEGLSYDDLPGGIQELLQDIKSRKAELNYKKLILAAIKRSASGQDRKRTWLKPSRRYDDDAPGTKMGDLPKLDFHLDTSGSISVDELTQFLDIGDEFLKVGCRRTNIHLFSDNCYYSAKYKLGDRSMQQKIKKSVHMGGTCLESTLRKIMEQRADLSIIVTDGCYGDVDYEKWLKPGQKFPQVLWIISQGGMESHPLKRLGNTVKVPAGTKDK